MSKEKGQPGENYSSHSALEKYSDPAECERKQIELQGKLLAHMRGHVGKMRGKYNVSCHQCISHTSAILVCQGMIRNIRASQNK